MRRSRPLRSSGRERGEHYLTVKDDGDGIPRDPNGLPDFKYVATHICDSVDRRDVWRIAAPGQRTLKPKSCYERDQNLSSTLEKDKATTNAESDSFGAGSSAELAEDRGHVKFGGVLRDG